MPFPRIDYVNDSKNDLKIQNCVILFIKGIVIVSIVNEFKYNKNIIQIE